jgi:hypothetical protein
MNDPELKVLETESLVVIRDKFPKVRCHYLFHSFYFYFVASMNDPELKILETESLVVIRDKFPKARHHYLVLPRERILNLSSLEAGHVPLLQEMCRVGRQLTERHPTAEFRFDPPHPILRQVSWFALFPYGLCINLL